MGMYQNILKSRLTKYCKENSIEDEDYGFLKYINEIFYRGNLTENEDCIITNAIVDGQSDKQIDIIQIEEEDIITIRIIQVKNTTGFSSNTIILLRNGLDWIFNRLLEEITSLKNIPFKDRILEVRDILENEEINKSNIYIDVCYITMGDKNDIKENDEIIAEIDLLNKKFGNLFENFRFELYGAKEISDYCDSENRKKIDANLSIIYDSNIPSIIENRYDHVKSLVCNVKAVELIKIFKEQKSEYLFEQNVRKYLDDKSKVNKNIISAAEGDDSEYFWALNNGVTIICDKYEYVPIGGKASVKIENLQIINGCQTSMALFAASKRGQLKENTSLLLRIHETNDPKVIEKIIIATNNQNPINPRDLVSNSGEQVELQKYFNEIYDIKYQRKRNDLIDAEGKKIDKKLIVSNDKVGQAALACIKCIPWTALGSKGKIFNDEADIFKKDKDKIVLAYFIYEKILQMAKNDDIKCDPSKSSIIKFGRFHINNLVYKKYESQTSIEFNKSVYHGDLSLREDILNAIDRIDEKLDEDEKHNLLAYFKSNANSKKIVKIKL